MIGDRIPFEHLIKKTIDEGDKAKFEIAKELKAKGENYDQIAIKIGYGSKGSVSKLFAKAKENGWDVSKEFPKET